jgi:hypothetical protein
MFERVVERLIQEAMREGKFDDLRGRGRPADLRSYFEVPADVRLVHATLRQAGFVPREVELLNEIADLKSAPKAKDRSAAASRDVQRLRRLELELGLLLEKGKAHRGPA